MFNSLSKICFVVRRTLWLLGWDRVFGRDWVGLGFEREIRWGRDEWRGDVVVLVGNR